MPVRDVLESLGGVVGLPCPLLGGPKGGKGGWFCLHGGSWSFCPCGLVDGSGVGLSAPLRPDPRLDRGVRSSLGGLGLAGGFHRSDHRDGDALSGVGGFDGGFLGGLQHGGRVALLAAGGLQLGADFVGGFLGQGRAGGDGFVVVGRPVGEVFTRNRAIVAESVLVLDHDFGGRLAPLNGGHAHAGWNALVVCPRVGAIQGVSGREVQGGLGGKHW